LQEFPAYVLTLVGNLKHLFFILIEQNTPSVCPQQQKKLHDFKMSFEGGYIKEAFQSIKRIQYKLAFRVNVCVGW
jgi:hypothetical protein